MTLVCPYIWGQPFVPVGRSDVRRSAVTEIPRGACYEHDTVPRPRPVRLARLLALAVTASGLLTPITGGAATAQSKPATAATVAALLDRPARLHVRDVSLADALGELERRSGVPLAYSPSLLPHDRSLRCACDDATIARGTAAAALAGRRSRSARRTVRSSSCPHRVRPSRDRRASADARTRSRRRTRDRHAVALCRSSSTRRPSPEESRTKPARRSRRAVVADSRAFASRRRRTTPASIAFPCRPTASSPAPTRCASRDSATVRRRCASRSRRDASRSTSQCRSQAVSLEQVVVTGTAGNQERRAQAAVVATIDASEVVSEAPVTNVTQLLSARVPGVVGDGWLGHDRQRDTRRSFAAPRRSRSRNQPLVFIDGVRVDGGFRGLFNVSGSGSLARVDRRRAR